VASQDKALKCQLHQIREKPGLLQAALVEIIFTNEKATLKNANHCCKLMDIWKQ